RAGDPIGQGDVGEIRRSEDFKKLQVGVACVLDIVSEVLLDVADVACTEVHRYSVRAGVEDRHLSLALDPVLPFVGVGMPVHLPQSSWAHRYQRGGDRGRNNEVAAVGNMHGASLGLARRGSRSEREGERMRRCTASTYRSAIRGQVAG